jgi:hypothetical protein
MKRISITEFAFPSEDGDEIIIFPCGNGYGACYREEEFNGEGFGFGACPLLAAADLVLPREA